MPKNVTLYTDPEKIAQQGKDAWFRGKIVGNCPYQKPLDIFWITAFKQARKQTLNQPKEHQS